VWVESKVIRLLSIIHNGIILDLVCGFLVGFGLVVLGVMFVLISLGEVRNPLSFIKKEPL